MSIKLCRDLVWADEFFGRRLHSKLVPCLDPKQMNTQNHSENAVFGIGFYRSYDGRLTM
jgi:hypothetical protein